MSEQESYAGRPTCTWVPVTDASGRTHMEARWTMAPVAPAAPAVAVAA